MRNFERIIVITQFSTKTFPLTIGILIKVRIMEFYQQHIKITFNKIKPSRFNYKLFSNSMSAII